MLREVLRSRKPESHRFQRKHPKPGIKLAVRLGPIAIKPRLSQWLAGRWPSTSGGQPVMEGASWGQNKQRSSAESTIECKSRIMGLVHSVSHA